MASEKPNGSFAFLFCDGKSDKLSEAGRQARKRLERNRLEAAERKVEEAEARFQSKKSTEAAYELGESYQELIDIFAGRERLPERTRVKRKLLRLLRWMTRAGIEIGDAEETLRLLEIEFQYRQMKGD